MEVNLPQLSSIYSRSIYSRNLPFNSHSVSTDYVWMTLNGWWPIILVFVFNVFDTVGRVIAGCLVGKVSSNSLLFMTVLKTVTIVPFVLAKHGVVGDIVVVLGMMALATANGAFATLGMIHGQKDVEAHEKVRILQTYIHMLSRFAVACLTPSKQLLPPCSQLTPTLIFVEWCYPGGRRIHNEFVPSIGYCRRSLRCIRSAATLKSWFTSRSLALVWSSRS